MIRAVLTGAFLVLVALPLAADEKADRKALDEKLAKALKAYNEGDYKKFFADYAKSMKDIATEQTFKALYEGNYKKLFGKYKDGSMKFVPEGSLLEGEFLILWYSAEFDKAKKVKIGVNFQKEDKDYKFVQIQFNEWKDE